MPDLRLEIARVAAEFVPIQQTGTAGFASKLFNSGD